MPLGLVSWLAAVTILVVLAWLYRLIPPWSVYRWRFLPGLFLQGILACAGAICQCREAAMEQDASAIHASPAPYVLTLVETLQEKKNSFATVARVYRVAEGRTFLVPGYCLVYFRKHAAVTQLEPGARIFMHRELLAIRGPLNPGEIDFRAIRARQKIFHQVFLADTGFLQLPGRDISPIRATLLHHRQRVLEILRTYIPDTTALGLAEAILVGYRTDLQEEIASAYARTGVMHVIAISGMHLSLIFSIILAAFRLVPSYGRNPWLSLLVALPAIWWFSLLTGASASVMRSAVMSSLPVLAAILHRRTDARNILCASATLLLAFRPGWLLDTGFQLSYAAVLGILLYQKKIQAIMPMRHPAAKSLWSLVSVTLAAQVFTTPLVIFYFRQFPLLFLFSNLVAVPLSSVILLSTLLLCGVSWMPAAAARAGALSESLVRMLNACILRMDSVPFSVIHHLYIDLPLLCIFFGILACMHRWISSGKAAYLYWLLCLVILAISWQGYRNRELSRQDCLLVLQVQGQTVLFQARGRSARQLILPAPGGDAARAGHALEKARQHYRISRYSTGLLERDRLQLLGGGGQRILVITGRASLADWHGGPAPDLVLLTGNCRVSLEACYRVSGCARIVADGSNALWKIQQWRKEAEKLPLRLHSTPQQGAFLLD
jgi:competence protein ComEC